MLTVDLSLGVNVFVVRVVTLQSVNLVIGVKLGAVETFVQQVGCVLKEQLQFLLIQPREDEVVRVVGPVQSLHADHLGELLGDMGLVCLHTFSLRNNVVQICYDELETAHQQLAHK